MHLPSIFGALSCLMLSAGAVAANQATAVPIPPDDPPSAQAVAAYLAETLSAEVAVTRHQCWKIKDGYQCQSLLRAMLAAGAGGRPRPHSLEITNDYQWREGRLYSARLEQHKAAMRPGPSP